jgi:hypothetical protein
MIVETKTGRIENVETIHIDTDYDTAITYAVLLSRNYLGWAKYVVPVTEVFNVYSDEDSENAYKNAIGTKGDFRIEVYGKG